MASTSALMPVKPAFPEPEAARGRRLVFVGGAPRSGTTLVQNMLDSHPDIFGGPEFIHIEALMRLRRGFLATDNYEWTRDFYSADQADALFARIIHDLLLPAADRKHARIISEKTPVNVLVFEDLLDLMPEAKCVHVVRDPRAVVASMLRAGARTRGTKAEREAPRDAAVRAFTTDVSEAILFVQRSYRAGFAAARRFPDRCLTIHYEALVRDPAAMSQRLCDFIGLPWSEAMLRPGDVEHPGERQMTQGFGDVYYDRTSYRSNPDVTRLERWRETLSPLHQALIADRFTGFEHNAMLPYDLTPSAGILARTLAPGYGRMLGLRRRLEEAFRRT